MINISLSILSLLLQSQPTRISKLVWVGAIVIFVAAISMLVYFLTRLKKGEKEQEEDDWRTSRRSLFVEPAEAGRGRVASRSRAGHGRDSRHGRAFDRSRAAWGDKF
jgi:hypothetical protein